MKEHKRAGDFKTKSEELKRRLDTVLRDQRQLVQRVGNAEARRYALSWILCHSRLRGLILLHIMASQLQLTHCFAACQFNAPYFQ